MASPAPPSSRRDLRRDESRPLRVPARQGLSATPEPTLYAATIAARRGDVEAKLATWMSEGKLAKVVGTPKLQLTSRPGSLVRELRKLIASEKTLDGVRIDRGVFVEDNAFVLSGLQDHDGQPSMSSRWPKMPPRRPGRICRRPAS